MLDIIIEKRIFLIPTDQRSIPPVVLGFWIPTYGDVLLKMIS